MNLQEDHIEIDEIGNLIDNVEMFAHFLESPISYKWKWAIIALHQALYGAMICTLRGSDPRQTVVDRQIDSGKAVMLHVNGVSVDVIASSFGKDEAKIREMLAKPFLITFDDALRRVKRKDCLPSLGNVQPLVTTAEEDEAIRTLTKEFRNEFEHFAPKAWIILQSILPPIAKNVIRVIKFLVLESNCINMSDEQLRHINKALDNIEGLLNSKNDPTTHTSDTSPATPRR